MNVRKLALDAIAKILYDGGYSNIVINDTLKKYELNEVDRALFTRLTLGTVEKKITLEYYLKPYLRKKTKTWVYCLLLMSIYQLVYLDIPDYAVVNEAVDMASVRDRSFGSFVNGVLRAFQRNERPNIDDLKGMEYLSIKYSYPEWLVAYLLRDYDEATLEKIFSYNDNAKEMALRINTLKATKEEIFNYLDEKGIGYTESSFVNNGIIVDSPIIREKIFINGKVVVQDLASQKVAETLNPKKDSIVLDLCAAPGSKTAHLASIMENTGTIYACDIYPHKIKLMQSNFNKLGVTNASCQQIDARRLKDYVKAKSFDYILADLPCSGLGVMGHKVDIRYNITLSSIEDIIHLQEEILDSIHDLLKVDGQMVVSTCTFNKDENEHQIANFLNNHPNYEILEEATYLPFDYGTDGFYICKLRRKY